MMIGNFLSALWWLPRMQALYYWLYQTSIGPMSQLYPGKLNAGFINNVSSIFYNMGHFPLLWTTCIALLSILPSLGKMRYHKNILILPLLSLGMIFPYLIILIFSGTSASRRILPGMCVFHTSLFIIGAYPQFRFFKFRQILLSILVICNILAVTSATFQIHIPVLSKLSFFTKYKKPFVEKDPTLETFSLLSRVPELNHSQKYTFAFFNMPDNLLITISDGWVMKTLALYLGRFNWSFGYPWNFRQIQDGYHLLREGYDYVIINVPQKSPVYTTDHEPDKRLARDIIQQWQTKQLESVNLKLVQTFNIWNRVVLLLKIKKG
jgi:hypothetical protein